VVVLFKGKFMTNKKKLTKIKNVVKKSIKKDPVMDALRKPIKI